MALVVGGHREVAAELRVTGREGLVRDRPAVAAAAVLQVPALPGAHRQLQLEVRLRRDHPLHVAVLGVAVGRLHVRRRRDRRRVLRIRRQIREAGDRGAARELRRDGRAGSVAASFAESATSGSFCAPAAPPAEPRITTSAAGSSEREHAEGPRMTSTESPEHLVLPRWTGPGAGIVPPPPTPRKQLCTHTQESAHRLASREPQLDFPHGDADLDAARPVDLPAPSRPDQAGLLLRSVLRLHEGATRGRGLITRAS